jgi:hypothetical protein
MKTEIIICCNCGKDVVKELKELKRQRKRGRTKFYCNQSCASIAEHKTNPERHKNADPAPLKGHERNRIDIFTPFRHFIHLIKTRIREHTKYHNYTDIDVEYLKILWDNQNGVCPLTGWRLNLPVTPQRGFEKVSPQNASLDRIDNKLGYVKGNIRFISVMANYARNNFTNEQVIEFCKAVALYHQT